MPEVGIEDCRGRTGFVADPDEVVEDRLGRQLLDDAGAGATAGEPCGDHGHIELLEGTSDIDPLAAGEDEDVARPVPVVELEDGHAHGAVERSVERDGDDHSGSSGEKRDEMVERTRRVPASATEGIGP